DGRKTRIKRRPQTPDGVGQRVCEILVFATPKPVPAHDNSTSETIVVAIERCQRAALLGVEEALDDSTAVVIQIARYPGPVEYGNAHRAPSRTSNACLRSTPHRYPLSPPSLRTTRWHGIATAIGLAPHACAT